MIKFITLAKRKKGLSMTEFMDYYDNKHAPLCIRLYPIIKKSVYRRNYFMHDQMLRPQGFDGEIEYDVMTESIWPDQATFDEFRASATSEESRALIAEDEKNLFDLDSMRMITVSVAENLPEG